MRTTFLGLALAAVVFLAGETAAVHESPAGPVQESGYSSPSQELGRRAYPSEQTSPRGSKRHHSSSSQVGDGYAPAHGRSRGQTPSSGQFSDRPRPSRPRDSRHSLKTPQRPLSVAATTRILSERNAAYNEDEQLAAAAAQTYTMEFRPRQRRSRKSNQRLVPHYARRQHWVNKVTPWIAPAVSAGLGAYKLYSAVKKRRLTEMKARQTHDDQQPSTDEEQPVMRPRRGISARRQNWLSKAAPYV
ncbi:unnamed protein product, partial [Aphanomyces euteiches]